MCATMNTSNRPFPPLTGVRTVFAAAALALAGAAAHAADLPPVRVFLLAGQSNMEGQGAVASVTNRNGGRGSLEFLAKDPATAARFRHLLAADGRWIVREDVWVWYLGNTGGLTPGFGARKDAIGPELGFGWVVGDAFDEPVLLVKLAWGGKSLAKDFRPPGAGGETGPSYLETVRLAKEVLADVGKVWPACAGRKAVLTGFGWHQGWNDRVNQAFNDEYEKNLAHFIRDIRREFDAPKLPFVIAETGQGGRDEVHPRALSLMRAQAAVAEYPEFRGNVAFVGTRDFWRPKESSPSGQSYHWNGNAETFYLIGEAMGKAMLQLCGPAAAKPERKP